MKVTSWAIPTGIFGLIGALLLTGCGGEKAIAVKGKLLLNGKPYQARIDTRREVPPGGEEEGLAEVLFISQDEEKPETYPADVKADGTFEVLGHRGKGIPPGKYRIVVQHKDPMTEEDRLQEWFSDENSQIVREVTGDGEEIVIDLVRPRG